MKKLPPIPNTFTELVASREYEICNDNVVEKITVEIGVPINDVVTISGKDWRCPIRIIRENKESNYYACGVDSYQALNIVMNQLVKLKLESIAIESGSKIMLYGEEYDFQL
jgi:hypothetical protein